MVRGGLIAALLALAAGCCNVVTRPEYGSTMWATPPYRCTCEVAECVAVPFSEPKGPEGAIARAWCTVLLPAFLVDVPFDAVADTVMLPWDACMGKKEAR
jgi:uncharacterized protein YceK